MFELEKDRENRLTQKVKRLGHGAKCLKFATPSFTGVPDRIILLPGATVVFCELKNLGKKERERQELVQDWLRGLGFKVFSRVDTFEKVDAVVEYCRGVIRDNG